MFPSTIFLMDHIRKAEPESPFGIDLYAINLLSLHPETPNERLPL